MRRLMQWGNESQRRGSILALSAVVLTLVFAFVAFTVDVGFIALTKSELQNAVDAATMAAAMELNSSLEPAEVEARAQHAAYDVAAENKAGDLPSVVIDTAGDDLQLGRRSWNSATQRYDYQWGPAAAPYNVVRVTARRDGTSNPPVNLFFAPLINQTEADLQVAAMATFQPRDIMLVLDYSGSMNDDSELKSVNRLPQSDIEQNLRQIWQELGSPKFGTLDFEPRPLSESTNRIKRDLGLDTVPYPYPDGSWDEFIYYVKSSDSLNASGYRNRYGAMTLINYWLQQRPLHSETPDLWKVSAQPITALKDSVKLFVDYLSSVQSEDVVGLSVYTVPQLGGAKLESPLTRDLNRVETISRQRQAAHYDNFTNIGAGMQVARQELEANARPDAYRMMVLMTDGLANRPTGNPVGFALSEARAAKAANIKIFTISLGAGADQDLMQEIADLTGGTHFNVPGGSSVADYEQQLKDAFRDIAATRPVKLID